MIAYVYRPKRRINGKMIARRTYRGRYRLQGEFFVTDVALDTADKQVAHAKLMALVQEKEREKAGLIAPRLEREAMSKPTLDHLEEYLHDLEALGRDPLYRQNTRYKLERLHRMRLRAPDEVFGGCLYRVEEQPEGNGGQDAQRILERRERFSQLAQAPREDHG
ncbi:MAG: hypothetical protein U1G07_24060 [Verrucomicrobiota bacterium]